MTAKCGVFSKMVVTPFALQRNVFETCYLVCRAQLKRVWGEIVGQAACTNGSATPKTFLSHAAERDAQVNVFSIQASFVGVLTNGAPTCVTSSCFGAHDLSNHSKRGA